LWQRYILFSLKLCQLIDLKKNRTVGWLLEIPALRVRVEKQIIQARDSHLGLHLYGHSLKMLYDICAFDFLYWWYQNYEWTTVLGTKWRTKKLHEETTPARSMILFVLFTTRLYKDHLIGLRVSTHFLGSSRLSVLMPIADSLAQPPQHCNPLPSPSTSLPSYHLWTCPWSGPHTVHAH